MSAFLTSLTVVANGNINPSVFLRVDPSTDFRVLQASAATHYQIGISQVGPKAAPNLIQALGGTSTDYAAQQNDSLGIYTMGDVCPLKVGSGAGVTAGDLLTSDSAGAAVTATTGNIAGALALSAANASELVDVLVLSPTKV